MAHGLAHRYAIAPRTGKLLPSYASSNDPLLSYSAHLYGFVLPKQAAADYDAFAAVYATYSAGMRHDLASTAPTGTNIRARCPPPFKVNDTI